MIWVNSSTDAIMDALFLLYGWENDHDDVLHFPYGNRTVDIMTLMLVTVRSQMCTCLVTWFCYQMIAKPGNKTGAPTWLTHMALSYRWWLGIHINAPGTQFFGPWWVLGTHNGGSLLKSLLVIAHHGHMVILYPQWEFLFESWGYRFILKWPQQLSSPCLSFSHDIDVIWVPWHLKSLPIRLYVKQLITTKRT